MVLVVLLVIYSFVQILLFDTPLTKLQKQDNGYTVQTTAVVTSKNEINYYGVFENNFLSNSSSSSIDPNSLILTYEQEKEH